MTKRASKGMSVTTIAMMIVVTTFGLANVVNNLVEIGLASIPSWLLVGVLYFLPLALILAEFASDTRETGGIYSYMERGLGPNWAFVGTWSYFVSSLVYLQSSFSILPIRLSLSISGADVFQSNALLLPLLGVIVCIFVTYLACLGVKRFSFLADWFGWGTLVLVALLVVAPIVLVLGGWRESATEFSAEAMVPQLDLDYFATFSWLLFAVAGAEVAAPYVNEARNPARDFPRAILTSTLVIAAIYVLSTIAMAIVVPLDSLTLATGLYDIWIGLANMVGLPPQLFARACMLFIVLGSVAAYVIWAESPIRAMFSEIPAGSFPGSLTKHSNGTYRNALWMQAAVVSILTLVPLLSVLAGMSGSERFIVLLNDLSSLSLVVPYVFIALAYIQARRGGMVAPFQMVRSTAMAIGIASMVLLVSIAGYLGAGLFALQAEEIDWLYVAIVYGGPIILIVLGLLLRSVSQKAFHRGQG
jgi:amino acid transporter